MEWNLILLLTVGAIGVLLTSGVWVAVVLGVTGVLVLWAGGYARVLESIGSIFWNQSGSFVLMAIPLFILMGEIILASGVSARFYRSISPWVRFLPGGLYNTNIAASAVFAAVSGSSVATAAAIGSVAIPELRQRGYGERLTFGTIAAGGTLGILIPPSSAMIIYGSIVNENIAKLFIAGILPGLMVTAIFMLFIMAAALLRPGMVPKGEETVTVPMLARSLPGMLPLVTLIVLVVGGIYTGVVTPTEAAALGAFGALVVGRVFGSLTMRQFLMAVRASVVSTAMLLFIILGAQVLSFALARTGVTRECVEWVVSFDLGPWQIFFLICILYLILGCFVDAISMMVLTLPIIHPLILALGFDSIWFGIVLVLLIEVGLITPPVGLNLYVIQNFAGRKNAFGDIVLGALPFVILMLLSIAILCIWPSIALWLPGRT